MISCMCAIEALQGELKKKDLAISSYEKMSQAEKSKSVQKLNSMSQRLGEVQNKNEELIDRLKCVCEDNHVEKLYEATNDTIQTLIDKTQKNKSVQDPALVSNSLNVSCENVNKLMKEIESLKCQLAQANQSKGCCKCEGTDERLTEENRHLKKNSMDLQECANARIENLEQQLQAAEKENQCACELKKQLIEEKERLAEIIEEMECESSEKPNRCSDKLRQLTIELQAEIMLREEAEQNNDILRQQLENISRNTSNPTDQLELLSSISRQFREENKQLKCANQKLKTQTAEKGTCTCSQGGSEPSMAKVAQENKALKEQCEEFLSEIEDLHAEINCLKKALQKNSAECECDEILELKEINALLEAEVADLRAEINCLKCCSAITKPNKSDEELQKLKAEMLKVMDENNKLKAANAKENEALNEKIRKSSLSEEGKEAEIIKLKKRIAELEALLKTSNEQNASCQCKELKEKLKQLEASLKKMKDQEASNKNTSCQCKDLKEKVQQLEASLKKMKDLEAANKNASCQCKELKEKLQQLEASQKKMKDLETSNKNASCTCKDPKDQGQNAKRKGSAGPDLQAELNKLKAKCQELEKANAAKDKQLQSINSKNAADKKRTSSQIAELDALKLQIKALKNENDELNSAMKDLKEKLQLDECHCEKATNLKNDMKTFENGLKNLETGAKDLPDTSSTMEASLADLTAMLESEQKKVASLEDELDQLRAENKRLKAAQVPDVPIDKLLDADRKKCCERCCEKVKRMESEHKQNLALLKEQYEKDQQFTRGRHCECLEKLQNTHEETIQDINKSYENQIDHYQKQYSESMQQIRRLSEEVDRERRNSQQHRPEKESQAIKQATAALCKQSAMMTDIKPEKVCCPCCCIKAAQEKRERESSSERMPNNDERQLERCPPPKTQKQNCPNTRCIKTITAEIEYTYPERTAGGVILTKRTIMTVDIEPQVSEIYDYKIKPITCPSCVPAQPSVCSIECLERDLKQKQITAQGNVLREQQRLKKLQSDLKQEKKMNSKLSQKIESHESQMKIQKEFFSYKMQNVGSQLQDQKARCRMYQDKLNEERASVMNLKRSLDIEKERLKAMKNKADDTIQVLKLKLEGSECNLPAKGHKEQTLDTIPQRQLMPTPAGTTFSNDLTYSNDKKKKNFHHECTLHRCDEFCKGHHKK